jgi:PKD repeat protein/lysophospholipase L1-like esterase
MPARRAAVVSRHRRRRAMAVVVLAIALTAMFAPGGVPAGQRAQAQAQDSTACAQWDVSGVTWGPFDTGSYYTPTVTFATSQDPTQVSGEMTLPEVQWETAAWAGPSQPFTGTLLGDKLNILVTPARTDTMISRGRYLGTITPSGSFTVGQPTDVQVNDGTDQDESHPERTGTWKVSGQATCAPCPSSSASPAAAPAGPSQALLADTPVSTTCRYVALGDSFSSGEGVPPFQASGNQCDRSMAAYSQLILGKKNVPQKVEFWACSGSRTDDFYNTNHDNANEVPQLQRLAADVSLVTLSVGGNDVGFADILAKCVAVVRTTESVLGQQNGDYLGGADSTAGCEVPVDQEVAPKITGLVGGNDLGRPCDGASCNLPALYQKIKAIAPKAQVYVIGPPSIFPNPPAEQDEKSTFLSNATYNCKPPARHEDGTDVKEALFGNQLSWGIWASDLRFLYQIFRKVNTQAAAAVQVAERNGAHDLHFVDLTDLFQNHDVCSADPYANGLTFHNGQFLPGSLKAQRSAWSFHPNAKGQAAMAAAIASAIAGGPPLQCQPLQTTQAPVDVSPGQDTLDVKASWPGSRIVVSLTSPSGRTYDASRQGPGVVHSVSSTSEGFSIPHPEPGRWTVNLFGADVKPSGEPVRLDTSQIPSSAFAPLAVIHASAERGIAPKTIQFDAANGMAFKGASIVNYEWDFGDGSPRAAGPNVSHTFSAGDYLTTLTVTDSAQRTYVTQRQIGISASEQKPVASFDFAATSTPPSTTIQFFGNGSVDYDGSIQAYAWDFGDGSHSTDVNPTHSYAQPGTYIASLTVTDDAGLKQSKQQTITVRLSASAGAGGGTSGVGGSVIVIIAAAVVALLIAVFLMLRRRIPVGVVAVPAAAGELLLSPEWRAAVAAADGVAVAAGGAPPRPRDPTASGGAPTLGDGAAKSASAAVDVYQALIVAQAPSTTRRMQNRRHQREAEDQDAAPKPRTELPETRE